MTHNIYRSTAYINASLASTFPHYFSAAQERLGAGKVLTYSQGLARLGSNPIGHSRRPSRAASDRCSTGRRSGAASQPDCRRLWRALWHNRKRGNLSSGPVRKARGRLRPPSLTHLSSSRCSSCSTGPSIGRYHSHSNPRNQGQNHARNDRQQTGHH
jgi:hypothetical protein